VGGLDANIGLKSALDPYLKFGLLSGTIGTVEYGIGCGSRTEEKSGQIRSVISK
jgi:hypothetical protein